MLFVDAGAAMPLKEKSVALTVAAGLQGKPFNLVAALPEHELNQSKKLNCVYY